MDRISRRQFLKGSGGVIAGSAAVGLGTYSTASASEIRTYRREVICHIGQAKEGSPFVFTYPDTGSPCVLLKLGKETPAGVGPDRDLVAYSSLCPHMGCGLKFNAENKCLECPCHFSIFDSEKEGQQVCGQSAQDLARIALEYDSSKGTVQAVGVVGAIYGRTANLIKGEKS